MKVVGIDPGYANLGIAILEVEGRTARFVGGQLIRTKKTEPYLTREARCIDAIVSNCRGSNIVGMEAQDRVFAKKHRSNAASQRVRRICGSVATVAAIEAAVLTEVTPQEMRGSLGLPTEATKQQMAQMLSRIVKDFPLPCSDHLSDAAAAAYAAWRRSR